MIEAPSLQLRITPAAELTVTGQMSTRVRQFVGDWTHFHSLERAPACRIEVVDVPRQHTGLGVGTQLGLSVAAGLTAFCRLPMPSPLELAISVRRGRRSAVGTYGFAEGGFLAAGGRRPEDLISPLDCRWEVPAKWRFVMICQRHTLGISDDSENQAFCGLSAASHETTQRLQSELRNCMIPALIQARFDEFAESVYRYGRLAGSCFAKEQGGPYNGPALTGIVQQIRSWGVHGVGQSSWGPTIFALVGCQADAVSLAADLAKHYSGREHDIWLSAANNRGADVTVVPAATPQDLGRTGRPCTGSPVGLSGGADRR